MKKLKELTKNKKAQVCAVIVVVAWLVWTYVPFVQAAV